MMDFEVISTEKGRKFLVIQGHKFAFQKPLAGGLRRWICWERRSTCRAYVKTDVEDNSVIEAVLNHTHDSYYPPFQDMKIAELQLKNDVKKSVNSVYGCSNKVPITKKCQLESKPEDIKTPTEAEDSDTTECLEFLRKTRKTYADKPPKRPLILIHRKPPATENATKKENIPTDQESCTNSHMITDKLEEDDEDAHIFGMGVAAKVKKLPNERLKIRVQRDIDMLLYDAIMGTGPYSNFIEEVDIKQETFDDFEMYTENDSDESNPFQECGIKIEDSEIM